MLENLDELFNKKKEEEKSERVAALSKELNTDFVDWNTLTEIFDTPDNKVTSAKSVVIKNAPAKRGDKKAGFVSKASTVSNKQLTINFTEKQREELVTLAAEEGRSMSDFIKYTIKNITKYKEPLISAQMPWESLKKITISISEKELEELSFYAKNRGRKRSDSIRFALVKPSSVNGQIFS